MNNKFMSLFFSSIALTVSTAGNADVINSFGDRTIYPGQHSAESNRFRQAFCAQRGAVDITNKGTVTLSSGTRDVIICGSSNKTRPGFSGAYIHAPGKEPDNKSVLPFSDLEEAPSYLPVPSEPDDADNSDSSSWIPIQPLILNKAP